MHSDNFPVFDSATWKLAVKAIILAYQDFIVVTILLFVSLSLLLLRPRLRHFIISTHLLGTIFIMIVGFINSVIQPIYNMPVSISVLQFSGVFHSGSTSTLFSYLPLSDLIMGSAIFSVAPLVVCLSALAVRKINPCSQGSILFCLVVTALYVLPSALVTSTTMVMHRAENGAIHLARSFYEKLPHISSVVGNAAFDPYESEFNTEQVLHDSARAPGTGSYSGAQGGSLSPIKNIVIFVLESVGAQYLDIYNGVPGTTPRLGSLLKQSILFSGGYAHVPSTPHSMFSILTSVQPGVHAYTLPVKNPRIALPTVTMKLKQRGYRTGIFLSSDSRYGKQDEFLHDRGVDTVQDARSRSCTGSLVSLDLFHKNSDRCTAGSLTEWIERAPKELFFALMWTDQTHFPYNTYTQRGGDEDHKARYLLGIREADAIIGEFVEFLEKHNLFRSTLIIVVGDHGEGFGQHGVRGHGTEIYDEFVRIPFLLINPVLFDGKVSRKSAGLIDIAPTILGLLGEKSPGSWQGLDLLSKASRKYNFSFVPWGNFKISYRAGDKRYIYDLAKDRVQAFDLEADPFEMQDIADTLTPIEIEEVKLRAEVFKRKQDQFLSQYDTGSVPPRLGEGRERPMCARLPRCRR
jgi:phosphoglycerol transferase MdoB-like AlkP superfamily enzyme